ncbi:MAG: exodeoxyribonuclease X C-terminal domain-containing protein [Candidatus Heimdallarchaeaceae archaeon]
MSKEKDFFTLLNERSQVSAERKLIVERLISKSFSELSEKERETLFRYLSQEQAHQWVFSLEMDELTKLFNFFVEKKKRIPGEMKIISFLMKRTPTRNILSEFALKVHKYMYDIRIMALQLAVKNNYIDLIEEIALNEYKSPVIVITAIKNIENPEVLTKIACGQIKLKKPPLNVESDVRIHAVFRLNDFENLDDNYYYTIAKESDCRSARVIAVRYIKDVNTSEKLLENAPLDTKAAVIAKLIRSSFEERIKLDMIRDVYLALFKEKMTFGKYKGKTIKYVIDKAEYYLKWAEEELPWYHDFNLYIEILNRLADFLTKNIKSL